MRRREFITLLGSAAASWPLAARAQSVRIGLFASDNPVMGPASDAFLDELRKEGFIDGQNLVVERKSTAQGSEALVAQALEMARANLDVLVALGSETTLQACARAIRSIPIVFVANNYDPIARGYVSSLARPGGNATGVFLRQTELAEKQVELLTEALPGRTRLAVVRDSISRISSMRRRSARGCCGSKFIRKKWKIHPTTSLRLFAALALAEPICFWFCPANFWPGIAINSPSMRSTSDSRDVHLQVLRGSRGPTVIRRGQRGDVPSWRNFCGQDFRGAKAFDLPVEQPTKYEMAVNLKTARTIGVEFPTSILLRADEVIE